MQDNFDDVDFAKKLSLPARVTLWLMILVSPAAYVVNAFTHFLY